LIESVTSKLAPTACAPDGPDSPSSPPHSGAIDGGDAPDGSHGQLGLGVGVAHGGEAGQHPGVDVGVGVGHGGYADGGEAPDGSHAGGLTGPWFDSGKHRIRTPASSGPASTITFGPYGKMSE
jgi:hypothetical protein